MLKKQVLAIVLLAASTTVTHAADDAAKKDPKTGKSCVSFFSSEPGDNGLLRMHFRNTCSTPFQIRIPVGENTRKKAIEAGSPETPAKAFVTCKSEDRCETAKWLYE